MLEKKWYALDVEEFCRELETDPERGLDAEEAADRLNRYGPNALQEKPK